MDFDSEAIGRVCRLLGVRSLSVFGSATTTAFDPETSDVDFFVEFVDDASGLFDAYFELKEELEVIVGRPVDLVMSKSLENPYFAAAFERTRQELYSA